MKTITAYQTDDMKVFTDRRAAERYEDELNEVARITQGLNRKIDDYEYVQHPTGTRERLLLALKKSKYTHPRYADDSDSPYRRAWHYLMCLDNKDRQWQQPFFADNPPINPTRLT